MGSLTSGVAVGMPYGLAVASGLVAGVADEVKFGSNQSISIGTAPEDVWEAGGVYTGQPEHSLPAELVEVFSSSASDAGPGVGARIVRLSGLDAAFAPQEEDVTLSGLTPVSTVSSWKRVFRLQVLTAGTSGSNVGTITARHAVTTANVFATITPGHGQTAVCAFTVPDGVNCYIRRVRLNISRLNGADGSAEYSIRVTPENSATRSIRRETITTAHGTQYDIDGGIFLPPKTDVLVRIDAVSDNSTSVSAALEYFFVEQ